MTNKRNRTLVISSQQGKCEVLVITDQRARWYTPNKKTLFLLDCAIMGKQTTVMLTSKGPEVFVKG